MEMSYGGPWDLFFQGNLNSWPCHVVKVASILIYTTKKHPSLRIRARGGGGLIKNPYIQNFDNQKEDYIYKSQSTQSLLYVYERFQSLE